CLQYASYPYTF
nr:immunoglobulin light chain junction region [Mus musculus]NSL97346.1 immunoglobulin light chain junction region [Mus musculus]NSL97818.1 immunoglobulin light chain junction region [Mus musculus]NSM00249.1 immunoglobulin light chain junction region [Mus musculus]NSM00758.1 immunoglobulin light chain junction region [Mus musculus]